MQHETTSRPRRIKVPGKPGIYFKPGPDRRRIYEITYLDSDKRRRWKSLPGLNLEQAEAQLDEIKSKLRAGERVAPSRITLSEYGDQWLDQATTHLRPKTRTRYGTALRGHVYRTLGDRRLNDITEDDIAQLISHLRDSGYAAWTIRGDLTALSRMFSHAVRRGAAPYNPVSRLDHGERPRIERRQMRVLNRVEMAALIDSAQSVYRPMIATALFSGARIGELLALTWSEIDFAAGRIRISHQLDDEGLRVEPKTPQAKRDVVMIDSLAHILREHKAASKFSTDRDFVFASLTGTPLNRDNARKRGLHPAVERAGLNQSDLPRFRFHNSPVGRWLRGEDVRELVLHFPCHLISMTCCIEQMGIPRKCDSS